MLLRRVVRDVSFCSVLFLIPPLASGQSKRIAVYDFDYKACRNDVIQVYGMDKNIGATAAQRLLSKLVGRGGIEVIDRNQIDRLMKEQNQKFSDRFDPADAPKYGKLLNVDAIVTGSVDALVDQLQNNRVGVGPVALGKAEAVAEATLSVRVISTSTAQIFLADQVNKKEKQTLGKGAKVGKNGGGGDALGTHPAAIAATAAIQAAADTIAEEIIAKADALPSRGSGGPATKGPATSPGSTAGSPASASSSAGMSVGRVDGSKVYINGGENLGVKLNDYFEVRRVTGTMKDPSGNDIPVDEKVDTIVVTDVQERFAVAKSVSGTPAAKEGDRLKKAKAPAAPPPKKAAPAANPPVPVKGK